MDKAIAKASSRASDDKKKLSSKFSAMLISHCRKEGYMIPDGEFLDLLDAFANGTVPDDAEESVSDDDFHGTGTQMIEDEAEEAPDSYEDEIKRDMQERQRKKFIVPGHPDFSKRTPKQSYRQYPPLKTEPVPK